MANTLAQTRIKKTRVLLVDDHALARESLKDMLADESDLEVIGEAANGREALALCSMVKPDLVMMDVRMPEMDGLEATRVVKKSHPKTSVLMVTMHENPDYLLEALRAGAAGYVLKDASQDEVLDAVRQVRIGEFPLDQDLATRLLRRLASEGQVGRFSPVNNNSRDKQPLEPLTPREIEVLGQLKLGLTNRQIGERLFISVGTVKNHVEHIITKLGVSDRTQAVVRSLELGLIDFSE